MDWTVLLLDDEVRKELDSLPKDVLASFLRISRLISSEGLHKVREPYVKHLEGPPLGNAFEGPGRNRTSCIRRYDGSARRCR